MKNKAALISVILLIIEASFCKISFADAVSAPNFTNLVVPAKFSDEGEFINDVYDTSSVMDILDNTYSKSMYSTADYFKTVSNGKMNMQTLYLFDGTDSVTLSKPRGYYAVRDDQNPDGYEESEKYMRMYELRKDWSEAIQAAIKNGNKPVDADGNRYDFSDLDRNGDGKIDLITVIYKETEQNISVSWGSPLWDYRDYSNYISIEENGTVYQSGEFVQMTSHFKNPNGNLAFYRGEDNLPIFSMGKIYHETMHALGPKDLYDSKQTGGVYFMSLMGKHTSPIGQYISVKERDALGWLDESMIRTIDDNGTYVISEASSNSGVVAYKRDLPNGKTMYIEYRRFDKFGNKYDNQNKNIYSYSMDSIIKNPYLKSGLVCYLANTDIRFPSNINTTNMEVVSHGIYSTKSDCAVGGGESLYVGAGDLWIDVTEMTEDKIEFEISGISKTEPEISGRQDNDKLFVTLKNANSGGTVLAAEYDKNGTLIRVLSHQAQSEITFTLLSQTKTAKVMWWDSAEKLTPVAVSKTFTK